MFNFLTIKKVNNNEISGEEEWASFHITSEENKKYVVDMKCLIC
jgi:hypothetical protein